MDKPSEPIHGPAEVHPRAAAAAAARHRHPSPDPATPAPDPASPPPDPASGAPAPARGAPAARGACLSTCLSARGAPAYLRGGGYAALPDLHRWGGRRGRSRLHAMDPPDLRVGEEEEGGAGMGS